MNVDVLIFPGHYSHLLQMFDVAIANSLKSKLKKELSEAGFRDFLENLSVADFCVKQKNTVDDMRSLLIESFFTAYEKVVTRKNCRASFRATGVSPYDPTRVLHSQYAVDPPNGAIFPTRTGRANSRWLTSDEALRAMFAEEFGREITPQDLEADIAQIYGELRQANLDQGIPLEDPPEVLIESNRERIYKLC